MPDFKKEKEINEEENKMKNLKKVFFNEEEVIIKEIKENDIKKMLYARRFFYI